MTIIDESFELTLPFKIMFDDLWYKATTKHDTSFDTKSNMLHLITTVSIVIPDICLAYLVDGSSLGFTTKKAKDKKAPHEVKH